MSTLREARKQYVTMLTEDPDFLATATYAPHQDEYIIPVYEDTTLDELITIYPRDAGRVVLAVLREDGSVGFNFWNTEPSMGEDRTPGLPFDDWDSPAEPITGEMTVREMHRWVEERGTDGGPMDRLLAFIIRSREEHKRRQRRKTD